jgi:hypothetical protein
MINERRDKLRVILVHETIVKKNPKISSYLGFQLNADERSRPPMKVFGFDFVGRWKFERNFRSVGRSFEEIKNVIGGRFFRK